MKTTEESVVAAMDGRQDTEIFPFLPYILQDFVEKHALGKAQQESCTSNPLGLELSNTLEVVNTFAYRND